MANHQLEIWFRISEHIAIQPRNYIPCTAIYQCISQIFTIHFIAFVSATMLFSGSDVTAIIAMLLCSMAPAGAIVLITELDNSLSGLVRLSPDSMRHALVQITQ
jgi:hypothetical protein